MSALSRLIVIAALLALLSPGIPAHAQRPDLALARWTHPIIPALRHSLAWAGRACALWWSDLQPTIRASGTTPGSRRKSRPRSPPGARSSG